MNSALLTVILIHLTLFIILIFMLEYSNFKNRKNNE